MASAEKEIGRGGERKKSAEGKRNMGVCFTLSPISSPFPLLFRRLSCRLLQTCKLNLSQEHHHYFNTFSAVQSLVVVLRSMELQLNNNNNNYDNNTNNNLLLLLCAFHKMIMPSHKINIIQLNILQLIKIKMYIKSI